MWNNNYSCTSWGRVYAHKICSLSCEKVIQNQKLWWINFLDGVLDIILAMYASRITELHSLYPNVAIYYTRCNRMSKVLSYSSAPHHTILHIFNWSANFETNRYTAIPISWMMSLFMNKWHPPSFHLVSLLAEHKGGLLEHCAYRLLAILFKINYRWSVLKLYLCSKRI